MITIFDTECNPVSQDYYDFILNNVQLHNLTCSCGHSCCLSIHGYYSRLVKSSDHTGTLRICRLKCSECGTTHAILLSSMVPYSQIPLSIQVQICSDYEEGRNPESVCEECLSVDENNVKSIISRYKRYWQEKLRSLRISFHPVFELVRDCFSNYFAQFMQIRKTPNILFRLTT